MNRRRHTVFVLLVAALLVVVASLAACGSKASVDPKTVLAQSSAAMKKIKGFHFVYEVHKPSSAKPGTGLQIARVIGDVNSKGDLQATINATMPNVPSLEVKAVIVGGTQYFNYSGKWQSIPSAESPFGELSLGAGTIRILDQITDTAYKGTENKAGKDTYHITGKISAADVKAIAGSVSTNNTFPTDIWIGVADSYVYEVDITGAATQDETSDVRRTIVLSNLDQFVDIKAPQ